MDTLTLTRTEADSAEKIQQAIDRAAARGGRVALPEIDLVLDRGLELRSGVELAGRGEKTVLRKGPGRVYPLTGYHNYGMRDVPVQDPAGLTKGMTVSVLDNLRRGFYETFARIEWIDGQWVGLDRGIEADYTADQSPRLTTAYPLIFGHGIRNAAVRDMVLDGRRQDQEAPMGGCRGAGVYFCQSRDVEVSGVTLSDYHGEGLGFQMCRDVRILRSRFVRNSGNGLHPGAGSTNCLFEDCESRYNDKCGFFFCVRATHITVSRCTFEANGIGVSIGTRDCRNRIESCRMTRNNGPGVLARPAARPVEVHSVEVIDCRIEDNCQSEGEGQVAVLSDAHDVIIEGNRIAGSAQRPGPGVFAAPTAARIWCSGNRFDGCSPDVQAAAAALAESRPQIVCGYGTAPPEAFRHLGAGQ